MTRRPDTRHPNDLTGLRTALYCRVSRDSTREAKSVNDQEALARVWAEREGVRIVGVLRDVSLSASVFATKPRPAYIELCRIIESGGTDLVWFWDMDRQARRGRTYHEFVELCQKMNVRPVEDGRVYDLEDDGDLLTLGIKSEVAAGKVRKQSKDVKRGKNASAHVGRRNGGIPFGYRPDYASDGRWIGDVPDMRSASGKPEDAPAAVVKEIYTRLLAGHSFRSIQRDLIARGIHPRRRDSHEISVCQLRYIATNPVYIGLRTHHVPKGTAFTDRVKYVLPDVATMWPPLVDKEAFWRVHRKISDPTRDKAAGLRPGSHRATSLLSAVARCAECAGPLQHRNPRGPHKHGQYSCQRRGCVHIHAALLDEYVEDRIVGFLREQRVYDHLIERDDSAAATEARGDVEQLRAELAALVRDVKTGAVSPVFATAAEDGLSERLADAELRVEHATLPPVLRGRIGPQAAKGWVKSDLETKRAIIRVVADIRVAQSQRVGRGTPRDYAVPAADRVRIGWLIGPDAE